MRLFAHCALVLLVGSAGCRAPAGGGYYPSYTPTYPAAPTYSLPSTPTAPVYGTQSALSILEGAKIVANDGTYLGKVTSNSYDSDSIGNTYGDYGSRYSSKSIFNEYGEYGGQFSIKSPFNKYTTTPPRIITQSGQWAYLTENELISPRIDTYVVIGYVKR
jgi:hypothetical protein